MIPTTVHWSIRVWRKVSLSIVTVRLSGSSERFIDGWPTRMTANAFRTVIVTVTTAQAVRARDRTMAKIWNMRWTPGRTSARTHPANEASLGVADGLVRVPLG